MTERLYYSDAYLREFRARVTASEDLGCRVYLDRTAFYPTSGGQPFDQGTLGGVAVLEVVDEEDRIAHILSAPLEILSAPLGVAEVAGSIDWSRRFDHMQQHTGQHLLSAVFEELHRVPTVSFHLGAESSTIDLQTADLQTPPDPARLEAVEERCAQIVGEGRPISISFEDAATATGLRKESGRGGTLRIVSIEALDRSACGGTHVRSTAEIGPILIRKVEKVRGNMRVEFVCGLRALRQARADYHALAAIARTLSTPMDRAAEALAAQAERIKTLEKIAHRQALDLAAREGRELHAATQPDESGLRRVTERRAIDEVTRARAQAFAGCGKAAYLAVCADPPSLLLAASADSGVDAGARVKAAVTALGGRGGGNPTIAQGSAPSLELLDLPALLGPRASAIRY
jgi:alanyl-tRNA synthetase